MSKKDKIEKTNAMRQLDSVGIEHAIGEYEYDETELSGEHAAEALGISKDEIFKTLVTRSNTGDYFVFVVPVASELNLKKAASAAGVKKIEMIHVKELLPLTGYVRGGCSPIGMKKPFPTFIDETAMLYDRIYISAGKRGAQIIINGEVLADFIGALLVDITA
ncbi:MULTISPECIES: Cys-tRNA(Pro) deacylase [Mogibacterium]|jgi:ybaK/ebsC protein|uniref:Cys-tRNA(Pro)/Cys-tRNA(Cys) deacylase n=1 Tax=Mogibacterium timidum ATCC 33093 TaxID=1401079 RepID=X8INQ1_9FIRM|nr:MULTISPECIES: Cys-tRNA(Pro) deacylase [Mogibacterium]EJU19286.1 YbaK/EbsC protein [Mogibacterium sp. CM50]EUC51733.1 Cys-tRNA(Pro) deacylase [Mogibacterium timidum ATCC 33093]